MLSDDPNLKNDLIDTLEPIEKQSRMEAQLPKEAVPKTLRPDPMRQYERKDIELPKLAKSRADSDDPRRVIP
jgi:hypothetical protein